MKKFRFSLETVLRVKRQVEDLRRRELAAAQGARDQVLALLDRRGSELRELNESQAAARAGKVDLQIERWFLGSHQALSAQISAGKRELLAKEALLDEARVRAVEAARERKVLEKLEERQRSIHQLQENREEQGSMDEMAQHAHSTLAFASPSAPA